MRKVSIPDHVLQELADDLVKVTGAQVVYKSRVVMCIKGGNHDLPFDVLHDAKDKFGFLLAMGIGSLIIIQVLLNIAVVTGLVPPTGLPLPFISAGSTSIIIFMSMIGIVQNIHKNSVSIDNFNKN